jgi:hypothetical protein
MSYRKNASGFVWDILKSNLKLLTYPVVRIVAMLVFLIAMSPLIFDMSAIKVADNIISASNDALNAAHSSLEQTSSTAQQNSQGSINAADDISNLLDHMNFLWLLSFLMVNWIIGVLTVGALTAQAIAMVRGEKKSVLYGYGIAIIRFPQLLLWAILSLVVGSIIQTIEQQKAIGLIIGALLGVGWAVLTFFSITSIMATGCGPFASITKSKNTITDTYKKITGEDSVDLKSIKRGLYIGGPIAIVNLFVVLIMSVLIFADVRGFLLGSHLVTVGAFITLLSLMLIANSFRGALWSILKAAVYVWAEEGSLDSAIDSSILKDAFVIPGHHRDSKNTVTTA